MRIFYRTDHGVCVAKNELAARWESCVLGIRPTLEGADITQVRNACASFPQDTTIRELKVQA